ncbi:hypothetical protein NHH03_27580, partial [Stieleria sp. TO1_6]|nr:hypothetical protein [Stieleria tagensis]
RCLSEPIAHSANDEDSCKGRFWQGRFSTQLLLDDAAILAGVTHVDVGATNTDAKKGTDGRALTGLADRKAALNGSDRQISQAITLDDTFLETAQSRLSASTQVSLSSEDYVTLAEWTKRRIDKRVRTSVPASSAEVLKALQLDADQWCKLIGSFSKVFKRAAGTPQSLKREAKKRGQRRMNAPGNPLSS